MTPPPGDVPPRVRVTGPRTGARRQRVVPSVQAEIEAQSEVGEIYLRSLLRAQLRVAGVVLVLLVVSVGSLPLLFSLFPGFFARHLLGMPLTWVLLGFAVYPVLVVLAWLYVRSAERNEHAFTEVVERS